MSGESLSSNNEKSQEKTNFDNLMAEFGDFDASKAKENIQHFKEEKEKREKEEHEAKKGESEQLAKEREERKAVEQAAAEQKKREHDSAWEKIQEESDIPKEILNAFVPRINERINDASKNGDELIDLTRSTTISYGPHLDFDRESQVSLLTGREIGEYHSRISDREFIGGTMLDDVFDKNPDRSEFGKEIINTAEDLMPQIAAAYEEKGFKVNLDKDGIITSIAWGNESEPKPEPKAEQSGFQSFLSRLKKLT